MIIPSAEPVNCIYYYLFDFTLRPTPEPVCIKTQDNQDRHPQKSLLPVSGLDPVAFNTFAIIMPDLMLG